MPTTIDSNANRTKCPIHFTTEEHLILPLKRSCNRIYFLLSGSSITLLLIFNKVVFPFFWLFSHITVGGKEKTVYFPYFIFYIDFYLDYNPLVITQKNYLDNSSYSRMKGKPEKGAEGELEELMEMMEIQKRE